MELYSNAIAPKFVQIPKIVLFKHYLIETIIYDNNISKITSLNHNFLAPTLPVFLELQYINFKYNNNTYLILNATYYNDCN